jgi:UDP-glucose 4-epimerase
VLQRARFVLGEDDDLPSPFGEPFEQPFDPLSDRDGRHLSTPAPVEGKAMLADTPPVPGGGISTPPPFRRGRLVRCVAAVANPGENGRALVTGGAGFIGSHLSELLLADGWEVYALDDLSTGSLANVEHLRDRHDFHLVVDSVLKPAVVNELVHKCDIVFHLAAAVGVRLIVERPVHTLVTNLEGTEVVLDHCSRFGKRVLVASTSEVYGDHREERPLEETDRRVYGPTTQRRWAYADSKAMDEFLALAYHQERGLDCVIVRLFNTVGPRQSAQYGMVAPRFVRAALAGAPLEIFGDGLQTRCFCHVADTIRALAGLMEDGATSGEIYNVGSQERVSIIDLAERVIEATDSTSELVYVPYESVYGRGIEDMIHRIPSIEKVRRAIGWAPTHDLDRILADVIEHIRSTPEPIGV